MAVRREFAIFSNEFVAQLRLAIEFERPIMDTDGAAIAVVVANHHAFYALDSVYPDEYHERVLNETARFFARFSDAREPIGLPAWPIQTMASFNAELRWSGRPRNHYEPDWYLTLRSWIENERWNRYSPPSAHNTIAPGALRALRLCLDDLVTQTGYKP